MSYAQQHLNESIEVIQKMDVAAIEKMADLLAKVMEIHILKGRFKCFFY